MRIGVEKTLEIANGLAVLSLLKAQLTELKGCHTCRVRRVVDQMPALEVGEGIIIGLIFLQRQPNQKFCGRLARMPGKEQRKTFELRDGTVVISKLKQME